MTYSIVGVMVNEGESIKLEDFPKADRSREKPETHGPEQF